MYTSISDTANSYVNIIFSPHLDDAIFSCAGLIAEQIKRGERVTVITVFAGQPNPRSLSAFARHIHRKWKLSDGDAIIIRRREDIKACEVLGASYEHWDFLEAIYRKDLDGNPLYCTYEALRGKSDFEDKLLEEILLKIILRIESEYKNGYIPKLYFPLGLAPHVDHKLLVNISYKLQRKGYEIFYYEEWPYVEEFAPAPFEIFKFYTEKIYPINIKNKIKSATFYISQSYGLGGSLNTMAKRLQKYAYQVGGKYPAERILKLIQFDKKIKLVIPFVPKKHKWYLRDFRKFIKSLRWHNLSEVLPQGAGICLDIGCGYGRHKEIVEQYGYRWIGIDISGSKFSIKANAQNLPFISKSCAGVVLWQVLEYLENPQDAFAESARVLQPGGIICGSVSFLEPVHGKTFYNISTLLLKNFLHKYGFEDINIIPGLNGFSLILWTWLRRYGGNKLSYLVLPLTAILIIPFAFLRFFISWVWWRLGYGTGYGMEWVLEKMPLEFAGHILFVGRKSN